MSSRQISLLTYEESWGSFEWTAIWIMNVRFLVGYSQWSCCACVACTEPERGGLSLIMSKLCSRWAFAEPDFVSSLPLPEPCEPLAPRSSPIVRSLFTEIFATIDLFRSNFLLPRSCKLIMRLTNQADPWTSIRVHIWRLVGLCAEIQRETQLQLCAGILLLIYIRVEPQQRHNLEPSATYVHPNEVIYPLICRVRADVKARGAEDLQCSWCRGSIDHTQAK